MLPVFPDSGDVARTQPGQRVVALDYLEEESALLEHVWPGEDLHDVPFAVLNRFHLFSEIGHQKIASVDLQCFVVTVVELEQSFVFAKPVDVYVEVGVICALGQIDVVLSRIIDAVESGLSEG